ncbi:MAG: SWIM zinc finger family protein [Bacteroidota bacterium]
MNWTTEYILGLAPNASSAQRGEKLATSRKWLELNGNTRILWGLCQGSGKTPYKTQIDLHGPAYKCSCPSRQFPCKHAIGLLLIYANQSDAFRISEDYPDWVRTWLERRDAAKDSTPPAVPAAPEEAAPNKAMEKRLLQMAGGLEDLETWLSDLVRQGMAESEKQTAEFWESFASRMVDTKLGGIGGRIRQLAELPHSSKEWPSDMLHALGELYMVCKGFSHREQLPPILRKELLSVAGINIRKEEVLAQQAVTDDWLILGLSIYNEGHLNVRKVWLRGQQSHRTALLLDYVHQSMEFPDYYTVGSAFNGSLAFYPSPYPQRALIKEKRPLTLVLDQLEGHESIQAFQQQHAQAIATNPWLQSFPVLLGPVTPCLHQDQLYLVDQQQQAVTVPASGQNWWQLLALSGGHPIQVFGEWRKQRFEALSIFSNGQLISLS